MTSAPIASRAHKDMVKGSCACCRASQSVSHERRFYENLGSNPRRLVGRYKEKTPQDFILAGLSLGRPSLLG